MTSKRISQLKEIISLEEKRADLQAKVDAIDEQIAAIQNTLYSPKGKPSIGSKGKAAIVTGRKGRGALREEILEALAAAGDKGVAVLELATLLNSKPANIHSWFSTNLKKTKGLKKVGEARYALSKAAASSIASAITQDEAAPKTTPSKRGRKPAAVVKAPAAKKAKTPAKTEKLPRKATTKGTAKALTSKKASPAPKKAAATPRVAKGKSAAKAPAKRGQLKAQIVDALKEAGASGITINELSEKLGVKYKNLYVWFLTTGKRIPEIQKVGTAQYAFK